jgi:peptidylprolyl isomerase domain and WD repeat-containing protein 1
MEEAALKADARHVAPVDPEQAKSPGKRTHAEMAATKAKPTGTRVDARPPPLPRETNSAADTADDSDSDSDSDVGPAPAPAAADDDASGATAPNKRRKKARRLAHEQLFVAALPSGERYSKSLMHREALSHAVFTPHTDFLLTASADGVVKFWKKTAVGGDVEFVKEFRAHAGEIRGLAVSVDGRSAASAGVDGSVKIWDVVTFDLLGALELGEGVTPSCVCWVHGRGASLPLLAVGIEGAPVVKIFDGRGENTTPLSEVKVHRKPVNVMAYNYHYDCVVSSDEGGMVEYWKPMSPDEKPEGIFQMKSSTNLFDFKKVWHSASPDSS